MQWLTLAFFGALLILAAAPALGPIAFEEIADRAGIHFVADNSPTANKNLPETMLAGVALFDYDNDGYLDMYFVNGAAIPSLKKESPKYWNRLFHNNRDGTFTDVTEKAGVKGEGYGIGVAVGDYDNDGWPDIFVANVTKNQLFHNNRNGTFTDVTDKAGVGGARDTASASRWEITTTMDGRTSSSPMSPRTSSFITTATARLRTSPTRPEWAGRGIRHRRRGGRLRQRWMAGHLRRQCH